MHPTSQDPGSTAGKLLPGDHLLPRLVTSIHGETTLLPSSDELTHLQLRRFAGCPICNLHLRSFVHRRAEMEAAGIHEVVVFHSSVDSMLPHHAELPFTAIADPEYHLYRELGIEFSRRAVLHPRAWTAPLHPHAWTVGVREMRSPSGGPFSLGGDTIFGHPADFLLEPEGRVRAVKYGRHANDQWTVDDLLRIADESPD